MTQTLKTEALVLHGLRWSESSKIIHFFTAERGSIKAIARGVLRPKSSLRGILENLNHVQLIISLKETRSLQIISQTDLINSIIKKKLFRGSTKLHKSYWNTFDAIQRGTN